MAANETRNVFFDTIAKEMEIDDRIVIISVDLAGPPFDEIRERFPNRYIPVGIAEQNAIAIACGVASTGMRPIVYVANPFTILRAYDQIRNAVCMMQLPVVIVGLGTGFSVSECGSTHFTVEDIALASLCQGLEIISISDLSLASYYGKSINKFNGPAYIRFGKFAQGVFALSDEDIANGYRMFGQKQQIAVITTGCTTKLVLDMKLNDVCVVDWFNISKIGPLWEFIKSVESLIVVEEQLLRGGIGSMILEKCNDNSISLPVSRIGIEMNRKYPQVYGDREYWLDKYGITKERLNNRISELKHE